MEGCILWSFRKVVFKAPKHNRKIVRGDFNAKVAKEYGYSPNVRKYSLHEEKNDNGCRVIDISMATEKYAPRNLEITHCFIY